MGEMLYKYKLGIMFSLSQNSETNHYKYYQAETITTFCQAINYFPKFIIHYHFPMTFRS